MQGTAAVAKLLQNVIRPGLTTAAAAANADPGYFSFFSPAGCL